ncbi:hypothetical protein Metok_0326 [Methanothermococcus okinawensis IH1]|uniref:Uncharacterized protein n=1 Tax=Methanothermococcus okinawensis (strain DSM 14208 / JCM 11175 / IH1) TaxID=647113 RepID=F8AKB6_METOI|nr:hypothetical protein Metok_0326 [Methanothermococcus okinawensis IH1]
MVIIVAKITPMMHDDIILWRAQGSSWRDISNRIQKEYQVKVSPSSVYEYYKRNLEKEANVRLKEMYEKEKGEGSVETELMRGIELLNKSLDVAEKILDREDLIKHPHQFQATVNAICSALKTKTELLIGQEKEEEDPIVKALMS